MFYISVRKRYPEKYTNLLDVYSLNVDVRACTCTQGVYLCFIKRLLRDHRQQHPQSSDSRRGKKQNKAKQQSTNKIKPKNNKKKQQQKTNKQSVHIETCDSAVTRSIGIEADTVTRPDDDLAPRMARIEARRSAKDRQQRSHPNVLE